MKIITKRSVAARLEMAVIAFFILAAISLLVVYATDPAIYAQTLQLASSPGDRYPVPVTLFLVGILTMIAVLTLGVLRHWRWLFWLMLVAFLGSAIQIPVTLLQVTGVLPTPYPLWYSLLRMGTGVVELALAVWMIQVYRHEGVWALGK
jgi:hypothetical protein